MYTHPMSLDRKLLDDLPVYPVAKENPDLFGLEIELEGTGIITHKDEIAKFWKQVKDGSLRQKMPGDEAIEYVFDGPLDMKHTTLAIEALFNHLNLPTVKVYPSYRTSIHVHLSCAMETHRTIYNLMALSIIFDELFTSQNGDHRIGNNFCLRARDAQGQIQQLISSIFNNGNFYGLNSENRYSSINFVSLAKFGTIEFRSLECTTDMARVIRWIKVLDRLRIMARKFENPRDIVQQYEQMSPTTFMYFILGDHASKYLQVEGWEAMIRSGVRLCNDFAYCSKWVNQTADSKPVKSKPIQMKKNPWNTTGSGASIANYYAQMMAQPPGEPMPMPSFASLYGSQAVTAAEEPQPTAEVEDVEINDLWMDEEDDD